MHPSHPFILISALLISALPSLIMGSHLITEWKPVCLLSHYLVIFFSLVKNRHYKNGPNKNTTSQFAYYFANKSLENDYIFSWLEAGRLASWLAGWRFALEIFPPRKIFLKLISFQTGKTFHIFCFIIESYFISYRQQLLLDCIVKSKKFQLSQV